MADNLRIVAFPEAGAGIVLMFRNRDIAGLQGLYGQEHQARVVTGLLGMDQELMQVCLTAAAKKDGKAIELSMDDLDHLPQAVVQEKLLDAYSLSMFGKSYVDQLQYTQAAMEKLAPDGASSPPLNPVASSASSAEQPSG